MARVCRIIRRLGLALMLLGLAGHQHDSPAPPGLACQTLNEAPATGSPGNPAFYVPRSGGQGHSPGIVSQVRAPYRKGSTGKASREDPRASNSQEIQQLSALVRKHAHLHGVEEKLVWAVMRQESGGNPRAVSPKGAMGLMQLMPGTADDLGVTDPFDLEQNIVGGIRYLVQCLDRFQQSVPLALAAYNAGPENVTKYQGCPPFAETRNYVTAVMGAYTRQWRPPGLENDASTSFPDSLRPGRISSLPWRVPLPKWKTVRPQVKIPPPQWKAGQRPS